MQIMVREHSMLHRQALILRAATFPLNEKDRQRLKVSLFHNLWCSARPFSSLAHQLFALAYLPLYTACHAAADGHCQTGVSQVTFVLACDICRLMPSTVLVVS